MKKAALYLLQSVLNSYAILFFSQNKILGCLLLAVSFFNITAGITGLVGVLFSVGILLVIGSNRENIRVGLYSFNALLLGVGVGTFYQYNAHLFVWLLIGCLITTLLSVTLVETLGKRGFPLLSLPFIITFWIFLLAVNGIYHMGLIQKNSAILNELSASDKTPSFNFPGMTAPVALPYYAGLFLRALSSVFFQNDVLAGIVISIGIFIHSRIHFSLLLLSFATACLFNGLTSTYQEGISYYHLGNNFMMTSAAIGSFFLIPSARSYLWAVIVVPLTFLLVNGFTKVFVIYDLPVLSLPFCMATLLMIYFFRFSFLKGKLQLTVVQNYSPERNLYQYLNSKERQNDLNYFRFNLPFMGEWTVSQGYDGGITHKDDWGKALDFVIKDEDGATFKYPGIKAEDFYCFNKPVLATAGGTVEEVVDAIEDNEIGQVNTIENWGNSVVIKHAAGLYSKVSHLKKKSVKVKPGDVVKQGDMLGMCGNSGRSPEPHLHFQVQLTPYVGSRTLEYPFAWYSAKSGMETKLCSYQVPQEGEALCPLEINASLKQAFKFQPGYSIALAADNGQNDTLEVFNDAFNQSYFYSKATGATAYFINNGASFYFTSFYGNQKSLLYYFYLAAYQVVFTTDGITAVTDLYPLQFSFNKIALCAQDLLAPFYRFTKLSYSNSIIADGQKIMINAAQQTEILGTTRNTMSAVLTIKDGNLKYFDVKMNGHNIETQWDI